MESIGEILSASEIMRQTVEKKREKEMRGEAKRREGENNSWREIRPRGNVESMGEMLTASVKGIKRREEKMSKRRRERQREKMHGI